MRARIRTVARFVLRLAIQIVVIVGVRLVNEEANTGVGGLDLRGMLVLRREVRYGSVA